MYFENLLNVVFGQREVLHIMECEICGYDEIYVRRFTYRETNRQSL